MLEHAIHEESPLRGFEPPQPRFTVTLNTAQTNVVDIEFPGRRSDKMLRKLCCYAYQPLCIEQFRSNSVKIPP